MNNNSTDWPMPRDVLEKTVKYAKNQPSYNDALHVIEYLNYMFRGCLNQEAFDMIDSIKAHFKEETEKLLENKIKEYYDRRLNKYLDLPEFDLDDEQIATAIIQTAPVMENHRDWGGLYIVLVDCCHWPEKYKEFERKVSRLDLSKMPAEKSFTYQGLQTGFNKTWPLKYRKWLMLDGNSIFNYCCPIKIGID